MYGNASTSGSEISLMEEILPSRTRIEAAEIFSFKTSVNNPLTVKSGIIDGMVNGEW